MPNPELHRQRLARAQELLEQTDHAAAVRGSQRVHQAWLAAITYSYTHRRGSDAETAGSLSRAA
ncbi:hypothetical protein [Nocardia miyunensis]|uniref:hypothetical protein n=1 Tax=Nocardia miyunensis TaxID=282684 RepID=UPI000835FE6B|nr:hypothetical protein [Nocardia miyunensis]